jgi:signal transduction histidine kinase
VLVGNFPKGFFSDKVVIIGSNYVSHSYDYINTPFSRDEKNSPKILVHAAIIDALIKDKTVYPLSRNVTFVLCVALAVFLSYLIARLKPTHGLTTTLLVTVSIFLISWMLFAFAGVWLYTAHLVMTVFIVYYIWVPFRAIKEYQTRFHIQEEAKMMKKVEGLKQNFISLMSHDLKTPVAKIAGMADVMLHQYKHDENLSKSLTAINDATKELNHFITSILDLTKIESQNLKLNKTSKDINTLIEEVVNELRFNATLKKIEIQKELNPLYPIEMDIVLTKRVISNLVENAIKYAGENKMVWVKSWDDSQWVFVEIRDNGVGISGSDLEYIFDKFYRVKNNSTHSIKGTGLGLYLVKYFVELQGGSISVTSKLDEGTTFLVKLKNA